MTRGFLKFIEQLCKVCTDSKSKNVFFGSSISKFTEQHIWPATKIKNIFFGSSISKFTEHHFRPTTRVKKLLYTHRDEDCIWNNTDPCDVSLDDTSDSKEQVNSTTTPLTIMLEGNNEIWYDTNEEYDVWHDATKTMDY